jgi:hypothetical protein
MAIRGAVIEEAGHAGEPAAARHVRLSVHEDLPPLEGHWCAFEQRADCTVFQSFGCLSGRFSKARAFFGRLASRLGGLVRASSQPRRESAMNRRHLPAHAACALLALAAAGAPVHALEYGVNIHHGGTPEFNAQRAALMKERNFTTARMDYISFHDVAPLRDQISRIRANGGSVEVVLWTKFGNDHSCNPDLAAVERFAYEDARQAVEKMKDLVHDYELLNETFQRTEIRAEIDLNHMGNSSAPYHGKPCMASLAAGLRGMSRAIRDVRARSGLPLRAILGSGGRDFGFLRFMQEEGVLFDVIGFHAYQEAISPSMLDDPWFGPGGPYAQLAKFGKPVHVNEFNCGEIYHPTYENEAGQPLAERCLKALNKHLSDLENQKSVTVEAVHFYELLDEPEKGRPEGEFGLMYDLRRPKPQLYLYTAFAGGNLTADERREITRRGLMSDAQISARRRVP